MLHAILILAHNEPEHLRRLISFFSENCIVLVHLDKKSSFSDSFIREIEDFPQVYKVYRKYKVNWGGFSILKTELFLLKEAFENTSAEYFHIISGQDYPVRPLVHFLEEFEKNKGKDYISYVHLPHPLWDHNTYSRFIYPWFNDYVSNPKNAKIQQKIINFLDYIGIRRNLPLVFPHLYGNSQWLSLTRNSVSLLLKYSNKKPKLLWSMRFTFAPEEVYISTVLCNLLNKNNIVWNKRLIRWKYENESRPAVLGVEHFKYIVYGNDLIARKFSKKYSSDLLRLVDNFLLKDNKLEILESGGWKYNGFLKYEVKIRISYMINDYISKMKFSDGIDIGCGCGANVALLREWGTPMTGFDANPYTPQLSSLLLPHNDIPCQVADLTEEIEDGVLFDIALCLDVLNFIPAHLTNKAISNCFELASKCIVFSIKENPNIETELFEHSSMLGFKYNKYLSCGLKAADNQLNYYVYEK